MLSREIARTVGAGGDSFFPRRLRANRDDNIKGDEGARQKKQVFLGPFIDSKQGE